VSDEKTKKTAPKVDFFADLKARANTAQRLSGGTSESDENGEKIEMLALASISANPDQPRRQASPEEDAELAADIKERGILQPVIVRPDPKSKDKYQLVAGQRRCEAARIAGLKQIPAIVKQYNDKEARTVAAIENLQRKDLDPQDEAHYFKFLADTYNLSNRAIADLIHKSASYVDQRMRLLDPNRVKSTQSLQDSQPAQKLWKYKRGEWQKIREFVAEAREGIDEGLVHATPKQRAELKETIQRLIWELEALGNSFD
jgi:ParB/RepB/Spo0J family partition protein